MKPLPRLFVKIFAPGIGDLVVLGPVLYNLKARRIVDKLYLIVYNEAQRQVAERMSWIDFCYLESESAGIIKERDFYIDMSEHPLEKIWWGSNEYIEKFGHLHAVQMMDKICGGMGLPDKLPELKVNELQPNPLKGTVLFAVGGRRRTKLMPNNIWLQLWKAVEKEGLKVALIGSPEHKGSEQINELKEAGMVHFVTKNMRETIDCINAAVGMISIDNGLYHISSYLNKPTVGLFGPMPDWLWGGFGKKTINLRNYCPINCTTAPLDWQCVGHPCMKEFDAGEILNTFFKVYKGDKSNYENSSL